LDGLLGFATGSLAIARQQHPGQLHIEERFDARHPLGQRNRFWFREEGRVAKIFQNQIMGVQQSQDIIEALRIRRGSQQGKRFEEKLLRAIQKQPLQEFPRGNRIGRESLDQVVETRFHLIG
jgi:hypothetical protein